MKHRAKITSSALNKLLISAFSHYKSGQVAGAVQMAQLIGLINELAWLKEKSPEQFNHFSSAFASGVARQQSYLSGIWFEFRICCLLIRGDFQFNKPDPPDFMIDYMSSSLSVECYSPRIRSLDNLYPSFKNSLISRKVRKYKNQLWTSSPSCLLIDGTVLIRSIGQTISHHDFELPLELKKCLVEFYQQSFYDLVVFMWFGHLTKANENASSSTCVWVPSNLKNDILNSFKSKLLQNFNEEIYISTIYPDMAND